MAIVTSEERFDFELEALEACGVDHGGADRFAAALTCVQARLDAVFGGSLRSLVVCGSHARGEGDELSDLDLWAIIGEPWSQFAFLHVHGIAIDVSVMSAYDVARETRRSAFYRNLAVDAAIAIDRDGTFAALRDRLLASESPPGERTVSWCRLRPHAVIRDAASAVRSGDPKAGLLLDAALLEIVALPGTLAGNGGRRPVRALAAVRRDVPGAGELLDAFHAASLEERPALLEQLAAHVLAEVGGPLQRFRSRRRWAL